MEAGATATGGVGGVPDHPETENVAEVIDQDQEVETGIFVTFLEFKVSHFSWEALQIFFSYKCTVVDKGIIIQILGFELGAFSETLRWLLSQIEFSVDGQKKTI